MEEICFLIFVFKCSLEIIKYTHLTIEVDDGLYGQYFTGQNGQFFLISKK